LSLSTGAAPDPKDPSVFDHWTRVTIRFADEDRMGHVNNSAYSVWLEASRVAYLESLYRPDATLDTVLARITIDYLRETHWPGEVQVGARLLGLGNTSIRSLYGVFRDAACLATCECVNVFFHPGERRPVAPPGPVREAFEAEIARLSA
jgi:acyl-CoA thioester hydrolase